MSQPLPSKVLSNDQGCGYHRLHAITTVSQVKVHHLGALKRTFLEDSGQWD